MDKRDIEKLLTELANQSPPDLPPDFQQGVWREIRARSSASTRDSIWDLFVTAFLQPKWAFSMAAVTLAVSVSIGSLGKTPPPSANHSLSLDVFSVDAPTLPSTLLARTR